LFTEIGTQSSNDTLWQQTLSSWFTTSTSRYLVSGALAVFASVLMYALNNAYTLIKARSTLHAVLYLLLYASFFPFLENLGGALIVLLLILSLLTWFTSYGNQWAPIYVFMTNVCLGCAALMMPELLSLLLLYFLFSFVFRIAYWRTYSASLIGISMPYVYFLIYAISKERMDLFYAYFSSIFSIETLSLDLFSFAHRWQLLLLVVLLLWSTVRYMSVRYRVKIKVRVYLDFIIILCFSLFLLIGLYPLSISLLLPTLLMSSSFFIGRFLSFSRRRLEAIVVLLLLITLFTFSFL
jgi:hypothetical protein